MNTRKHYLSNHTVGQPVQIAAEAYAQAAATEGERVEMVDGHAVMIFGADPDGEQIEAFAASADRWARAEAGTATAGQKAA